MLGDEAMAQQAVTDLDQECCAGGRWIGVTLIDIKTICVAEKVLEIL